MTNNIIVAANERLALTQEEQAMMQSLLNAHDRGGFYMVYNAMTDSTEASLQSRISTFSGFVGGAALAANRLDQTQIGPGTSSNSYPGMYVLSQNIAQSAFETTDRKLGITANLAANAGLIDDGEFFRTAKAAWIDADYGDSAFNY